MRDVVLVIYNVRSAHNVGSLLRTADGLGLKQVVFAGYTPYPEIKGDKRLPHIAKRAGEQISKTALGADNSLNLKQFDYIGEALAKLKQGDYFIAALEQAPGSYDIGHYQPPDKLALIVGNEVDGIDEKTLALADACLSIPMKGAKESFNVAVAGAMALYALTQAT